MLDRSGPLLKQTEKGQRLLDKAKKIIEIEQELELDMKPDERDSSLWGLGCSVLRAHRPTKELEES